MICSARRAPGNACHPERSGRFASEAAAQSKDPYSLADAAYSTKPDPDAIVSATGRGPSTPPDDSLRESAGSAQDDTGGFRKEHLWRVHQLLQVLQLGGKVRVRMRGQKILHRVQLLGCQIFPVSLFVQTDESGESVPISRV